jgi:2-polyprenyl-6-methoxyphenol hydroxylase-like FAD-dependent oxidoreductase
VSEGTASRTSCKDFALNPGRSRKTPAEQRALDLTKMHPDAPGPLCIGHPAMCNAFAESASSAGAVFLKGAKDIDCVQGNSPLATFSHEGKRLELKPRLMIGADGRNSVIRRQLDFRTEADEPHNLLGGMLVANVPDWPREMQAIGTEDRLHYLIFPQGKDLVRQLCLLRFRRQGQIYGAEQNRAGASSVPTELLASCGCYTRGDPHRSILLLFK